MRAPSWMSWRARALAALGFEEKGAVVVTAGAQGTKKLGIEGEDAVGVYHAKDVVYHYNSLPPFSESLPAKSLLPKPLA